MSVLTLAQLTLTQRRALGARRLAALGVSAPLPDRSPAAVVAALGAMQAQDLSGGLWSIGVRTGRPLTAVLEAAASGAIVRTWPMRGTLHWVPGRDAAWMCALLSGPAIRAAGRVFARVGLTDAILGRAGEVLDQALQAGHTLTRSQALAALSGAGIDVSGQRGYYLLVRLSQTGLLAQAAMQRTPTGALEPTFGLLEHLVPTPARPDAEQAAAVLVERFVRSHGPVTEADVARWCDQPLAFVRAGVAGAGEWVRRETFAGTAYLVHAQAPGPVTDPDTAWLLPGFDEWLLGYRDRRAQLTQAQEQAVVPGGNGVFRGTVVAGSIVIGTWRRSGARTGPVRIEVDSFEPVSARTRRAVQDAAAAYGAFWERPALLVWA